MSLHLKALISIPSDTAEGNADEMAVAKMADDALRREGSDGSNEAGGSSLLATFLACAYADDLLVISTYA